jgi:mannopine transport system permease protein
VNHATLDPKAVALLLGPLCLLLAAFFVHPLLLVAWTSVGADKLGLDAYVSLLNSTLFKRVLANTFEISALATLVSLVFGYVIALHIARASPRRRTLYLVMIMLPFWTSILVKSFAFTVVLGEQGIVNRALGAVTDGAVHLDMMFNRAGVVIGMVNYLLPFMVLPILASLLAQDRALHRAAEIMGAGPVRIFLRVTLPLSAPGVQAGILMNMTLAMGMYITPALLGGRRDMMLANLVDFYTRQTLDWNVASAIAIVLLVISGVFIALLARVGGTRQVLQHAHA